MLYHVRAALCKAMRCLEAIFLRRHLTFHIGSRAAKEQK